MSLVRSATMHSLVIGQISMDEKSNEFSISQNFSVLDIKGKIITTGIKMGCQKDIAEKIQKQEVIIYLPVNNRAAK